MDERAAAFEGRSPIEWLRETATKPGGVIYLTNDPAAVPLDPNNAIGVMEAWVHTAALALASKLEEAARDIGEAVNVARLTHLSRTDASMGVLKAVLRAKMAGNEEISSLVSSLDMLQGQEWAQKSKEPPPEGEGSE